jgi:hypothetical protein
MNCAWSYSRKLRASETKTMTDDPAIPRYSHTQKAPLCLLIYALAVLFVALGWFVQDAPPIPWLFPPIGLLMLVLAASIHHLSVVDQGDKMAVAFGPMPLMRTTIPYCEIKSVETGPWRLGLEHLGAGLRGNPSKKRSDSDRYRRCRKSC